MAHTTETNKHIFIILVFNIHCHVPNYLEISAQEASWIEITDDAQLEQVEASSQA